MNLMIVGYETKSSQFFVYWVDPIFE